MFAQYSVLQRRSGCGTVQNRKVEGKDVKDLLSDNSHSVRDIIMPDGSVRHNVGSDNLSDEDRAAMELTDEQVQALNADEEKMQRSAL